MTFHLSERIKKIYLNMFGNSELLKGVSIKEVPGQVLMPPDYTPMKRQLAVEMEEETIEERLRKLFWQANFQRKMILYWLSERNKPKN
jgi:hypothetical protein